MGNLVQVSSGDLITAQRQNDINGYIEEGTHAIVTLSLEATGGGDIKTTGNFTDGTNSITAAQMKSAYDERLIPNIDEKTGANCSGTDGEINRTLQLSSTPYVVGLVFVSGTPIHPTAQFTLSGDTITFLNKIWDSANITVLYFIKGVL